MRKKNGEFSISRKEKLLKFFLSKRIFFAANCKYAKIAGTG